MKNWKVLCLAVALLACLLAGCGNVTLRGDALTAAENSTMAAYQAVIRGDIATTQPTTAPAWQKAYLGENFKQWRYFVRSARKDLTWGPTLNGE